MDDRFIEDETPSPNILIPINEDPFFQRYSRFMKGKIQMLFDIKMDNISLDERISPYIDEDSKTYYFLDRNNISYAVTVILTNNGEPIDYKAGKIIEE